MTIHVGQGVTVGPVTVFPVWDTRTTTAGRGYTTGDDRLEVAEAPGGASVPQLVAVNRGELPVLVLDGQLFEGGLQHRMSVRSTFVAPRATASLDVACVEQGRWGGTSHQSTRGRRATTRVRQGYDVGGQTEVWSRVAGHGVASPSQSLLARMDQPDDLARRLRLRVRPLAGQVGVLLGVGGQPLALELFDHPDTFAEQLGSVLDAVCLDAVGAPAVPTPGRRARRMVRRLEATSLAVDTRYSRPSAGVLRRARTTDLDVMSLTPRLDRSVQPVHLRVAYRRHPVLQGA